jgi:hypothetical protein
VNYPYPPFLRFFTTSQASSDKDALALYDDSFHKLQKVPGFGETWNKFCRTEDGYGYSFEITFARWLFESHINFGMNYPNHSNTFDFLIDSHIACEISCDNELYETSRLQERINRYLRDACIKGRWKFRLSLPCLVGTYRESKAAQVKIVQAVERLVQEPGDLTLGIDEGKIDISFDPSGKCFAMWSFTSDVPIENVIFSRLCEATIREASQLPTSKPGIVIYNTIHGLQHFRSYIDQPNRIPPNFISNWPAHLQAVALWDCDYHRYIPNHAWLLRREFVDPQILKLFSSTKINDIVLKS